MANHAAMNTKGNNRDRSNLAFTLIELITVIAIMGIVAALVVTMGQAASQKKKIMAVEADKNKIITFLNSYHAKLNYYPPDNGLLAGLEVNSAATRKLYENYSATNPLVYELYGATNTNSGANLIVFNSSITAPDILTTNYGKVFNRGGIANGDASEPQNFFQPGPLPKEYAPYAAGNSTTPPIVGLIVPAELVPGNTNNFWHYDSSSPNRHNMGSYDLWAEFYIGSKGVNKTIITNGNW
jgi:prepilin-type N-terminal cleavage/methylation domain-containing protein